MRKDFYDLNWSHPEQRPVKTLSRKGSKVGLMIIKHWIKAYISIYKKVQMIVVTGG